jgi:vacuolar-type H+-ATPase subunit F/Vma7
MLAGVETQECATAEDFMQAVTEALRDRELGVLLVDEALVTMLDPKTLRALEASERPLAIVVPLDISAGAAREYLEQMIRRIIGYQVRLE